jgi:hypothetical protein
VVEAEEVDNQTTEIEDIPVVDGTIAGLEVVMTVAAMTIDVAEEAGVMIVAAAAGPVLETAAGDKHKLLPLYAIH